MVYLLLKEQTIRHKIYVWEYALRLLTIKEVCNATSRLYIRRRTYPPK